MLCCSWDWCFVCGCYKYFNVLKCDMVCWFGYSWFLMGYLFILVNFDWSLVNCFLILFSLLLGFLILGLEDFINLLVIVLKNVVCCVCIVLKLGILVIGLVMVMFFIILDWFLCSILKDVVRNCGMMLLVWLV